jgi:antitoxin CcdA
MATLTIHDVDDEVLARLTELAKANGRSVDAEARAMLADATRTVRAPTTPEQWLAENRDALESSNAYVERHGLPLQRHRKF